jgi:intein-encoded DNA endonuclease-like protein
LSSRVITEEEKAEWVELYKGGLCCREIAIRRGYTKKMVEKTIRELNLTRSKSEIGILKGPKYLRYHSTWIELYKGGRDCNDIASEYNCDASRVRNVVRNAGVMRSKSDYIKLWRKDVVYTEDRQGYHMFDAIDSELSAYWLGFIYADGNITRDMRTLRIGLGVKDSGHLEKFAGILGIECRIKSNTLGQSICTCLAHSTHIVKTLDSIGVHCGKSYIDSAEVFNYVPDNLMCHFIRGIFDGDGSVGIHNNHRYITYHFNIVGVKSAMSRIRDIFFSNAGTNIGNISFHSNSYIIGWGGRRDMIKLRNYLYKDSTIYLERKRDIFYNIPEVNRWGK